MDGNWLRKKFVDETGLDQAIRPSSITSYTEWLEKLVLGRLMPIKKIATDFFYYWFNYKGGTNTDQAFDDWYKPIVEGSLEAGTIIELQNSERFKIIKVFSGNMVDIQAVKAPYDFMPGYKPTFYSIQLKNYKIVEE